MRRLSLLLVSVLFGCGDDEGTRGAADAGGDGDADTDTDTDADTDGDSDGDGPAWTIEEVDADDAGSVLSLAVGASGEVGIAYYPLRGADTGGECFEWELRFASGAPGVMQVEVVDTSPFLLAPTGVTVRYDGDTPSIVAQAGGPDPERPAYCGANDLHLLGRTAPGAWSREVVAADSGETPTTEECVAAATSTFGWVVGRSPAIAIDPAGQMAIAWRDTHADGTLQSKDFLAADLESALGRPGAFTKEMIDCGTGAGDDTTLAWAPDGGLVAAWYNSAADAGRRGIWVGRRTGPAAWEEHQLFAGEVRPRPSMAIAPDGTVGVVWTQDEALRYASIAPGRPLSEAVIESASPISDNAGRYSSLAYGPDGRPLVAHYRCNRLTNDTDTCDPAEDGPVLTWWTADGWRSEDIEPPNDLLCGQDTQIGLLPDGTIVVAYACQTYDAVSQTFGSVLKLASRSAP